MAPSPSDTPGSPSLSSSSFSESSSSAKDPRSAAAAASTGDLAGDSGGDTSAPVWSTSAPVGSIHAVLASAPILRRSSSVTGASGGIVSSLDRVTVTSHCGGDAPRPRPATTSGGRYLSWDLVKRSRRVTSRSLCRAIRSASLPACAAYISWKARRLATSARHAR